MDREEKFNIIRETILKNIEVDGIVIFGSYARNKERPDSDIDIAIKPIYEMEKAKQIELQNLIEKAINMDVHLINLNTIEEDFRYDILITGKTLYVRNEVEFIEYKLGAYRDYLELSEDRKIIVDKLKDGGSLYG